MANASFSADATTTVRVVLTDGTRIERVGRARYYRDRIGRVRVEQAIIGLEALNQAADGQTRITIYPDPGRGGFFTLDPVARTVALGGRSTASSGVGGGQNFALSLGGPYFLTFGRGDQSFERYGIDSNAIHEESLGIQQISGVATTGKRITTTIPAGSHIGNDRPFQIIDERWESTEVKRLILTTTLPPTGSEASPEEVAQLRRLIEREIARERRILVVPVLTSYGGTEAAIEEQLRGLAHEVAPSALMPDDRLVAWIVSRAEAAPLAADQPQPVR